VSVAAKKGTKMAAKWSPARGAVQSEPFPLLRSVVRMGAAKRTLDGEDRSERIAEEGKAGRKFGETWSAILVPSPAASNITARSMTGSGRFSTPPRMCCRPAQLRRTPGIAKASFCRPTGCFSGGGATGAGRWRLSFGIIGTSGLKVLVPGPTGALGTTVFLSRARSIGPFPTFPIRRY
jgi:hypothetical protein